MITDTHAHVFWSDFDADRARVLSGLVQNGMRAVPLDVRSADFDGLLRPGDRVDVLFSTGAKGDDGSTQTLLQNLLVLSVVGVLERASDGEPVPAARGSVTLSATIEQAQILTPVTTPTLPSHNECN